MKTSTHTTISLTGLTRLSSFASYLLERRLDDFVAVQLRLSEEINLPILRFFKDLSHEELMDMGRKGATDLLSYLIRNEADVQIAQAIRQWKENQMPRIKKHEIVAEDVTLIAYTRKQAFLSFVQDYCANIEDAVELIREIDFFVMSSETALTNTYIQLLKEKISEDSLLIEKVNQTVPGAIYVFDLDQFRGIYSNNKLGEIIGYEHDELNELAERSIATLLHPEDQSGLTSHLEELRKAKDGEIRSFKYRIKDRNGTYRWLSNHESVFKRDENGRVVQTIGITLDIDQEQKVSEALRESKSVYQQSEALANMGNWSWDLTTGKLEWTDQLYRIYGLAPQSEVMTIDHFLSFVHPDDRDYVRGGTGEDFNENILDYTFRIVTQDGRTKVLRSVAQVHRDENGRPLRIIGTERDVTEKQNLIDKLRKSESLYKQAQGLAHVGNWSWDIPSNGIEWSDELYRIYGLETQSRTIDYNEFISYVHPDDRERVQAQVRHALETGESWEYTHRLIRDNGEVRVVNATGEVLRDEKGRPYMMIGTSQDVTERQNLIERLKDNQTFIRKIADATPSIIASYNVNTGKYVFISEGLEKLLGYHQLELMERGVAFLMEIIHPDDIGPMMENNARALQEANENPSKNDMVVEFTYRMRHQQGHYRWFHTYGTIFDRNAEGGIEHVLNISLDVTDQVGALEKIKEQEHFIQQIADASPTILYLYNADTQSIEYINREIFFVLGYMPEEIIEAGAQITDQLYHAEDHHLLPGRIQSNKTFQQVDSMIQYECRMRNKEGEWRWLLVREIVFKTDDEGNISQILGAALDINRRKDMEKTILQNTLLLEQSNASLEEFAYVASHDLKEPLRKISTFGDRLVATQLDKLAPEGKVYLQKIVDASQRMQTMISDLLSISMITGNTSFEPYSLQTIFDETLQTLEFKIEQQNALVTSDPLPVANIIPSQFRQLFQNLLSNSLKFVRSGVQPSIRVTHKLLPAQDMVHYQLTEAENYHQLLFSDNGIGFENEFAGKIFAIFQRLHGRSEYEGSGIGLAICKKIVEHHGGIIYASGIPDEGATFTIILPA